MIIKILQKGLLLILFCSTLLACSSKEDKPHYKISTDTLRSYAGNEQLSFAVTGQHLTDTGSLLEIQGDVYLNYGSSSQTVYPGDGTTIAHARVEQFRTDIPNIPQEDLQRHFYQDANGSLILYAIKLDSQELLWLLPKDTTSNPGIEMISSPLTQSDYQQEFDVWQCDNICSKVGFGAESMRYVEAETVSTPYAIFDTYRFDYSLVLNSTDPAFDDSDYQSISANFWIYPELGAVKFFRTRTSTADGQISYKGFLTSTNVNL